MRVWAAVLVGGLIASQLLAGDSRAQSEKEISDALSSTSASAEPPSPSPPETAEPPPMRPRAHGLVVESALGVLGFAGAFRHVAPPAYWFHAQVGYELGEVLMVFVEGETALTDTGESQEEVDALGVTLWGVGGGARATVHLGDRVGLYGQGEVGTFAAYVKHDELTLLGFRRAESVNPAAGGRLGVEWYQVDRHMAVSAAAGARYADGFGKLVGPKDLPLLWDAALSLRYAF